MVTSSTTGAQRKEAGNQVIVGLLADPEGSPVEVATQLGQSLAGVLAEHIDDNTAWVVHVTYERLPPGS